jgi:uncharacterized protein YqjF (DUF2071 family)
MFQEWRDLLFLHWEYSKEEIQRTLPRGLFVDTFHGKAYLGLVPFFMQNIRPRFSPTIPGVSNFLETNVRTYVHDANGVPGVWFYSLDANQKLAVAVARRFFHLPYQHARMVAEKSKEEIIHYTTQRSGTATDSVFEYVAGTEVPRPCPGSLEFFLIERYLLYASCREQLFRGAVHHPPYGLHEVKVSRLSDALLTLSGFHMAGRAPDHAVMSKGVDVSVFPLKKA